MAFRIYVLKGAYSIISSISFRLYVSHALALVFFRFLVFVAWNPKGVVGVAGSGASDW